MGNMHKTLKSLLGATALTAISATTAHAGGTEAGLPVTNTFTLTYDVNMTPQQAIDTSGTLPGTTADPTTFIVDRFVDLTVSSVADTPVAPGQTGAELVFMLVNDGNGDQSYIFDVEDETGDGFDPDTYVVKYFRDNGAGSVGTFDPSDDTTEFAATDYATIAPDEVIWVVVEANIPSVGGSAVADDAFSFDGESGTISLLATTTDDGTGTAVVGVGPTDNNDLAVEENVFGDTDGTHDDDAVADGEHSAQASYDVVASIITGAKDVFMYAEDDTGCTVMGTVVDTAPVTSVNHSLPGACVEYIISATASGSGVPTNIDITDTLPEDLIFQGVSTSGFDTAPTLSSLTVPTDCAASACAITATDGTLVAGATGYLHIRATIK